MGLEKPTHNPTNPIHNVDNIICISLLRYCRSISHRQWRNLQQHGENHITVTKCNKMGEVYYHNHLRLYAI